MLPRLQLYFQLIRIDKPIGILLLLWPTLNALWIASKGWPGWLLLSIFSLGTLLMRSAGCAINDYADRNFDRYVKRTVDRPLASGHIRSYEAITIAVVLSTFSFLLLLPLNTLTKELSVIAVIIGGTYPFTKRFFILPQAYLGIAFGFGILMAFSAVQNTVPLIAWFMLIANIFWSIAYDTEYAMVDLDDDIKIGIKTSALTFGRFEIIAILFCYAFMLGIYWWIGITLSFGSAFWIGWSVNLISILYQYALIRGRKPILCFMAFQNNGYLGGFLFFGIAMQYALHSSI
ncbi:MAG: 4-hydroxybenzoate octaprenyltransferase [Burkholderia sp.]|nr:4-hydroxybenzoate octaprenyltransferase [Burkholderia sp.]